MRAVDEDVLAGRLQLALELSAAGEQLMKQNLRRRHPAAPEDEIARRLGQWLRERPGAEGGDATGLPTPWPRRKA